MTAQEQQPDNGRLQELADRQLRLEQRYFDCLNEIFTRLEAVCTQNENLRFCQEECRMIKQEQHCLSLAHQAELARLAETIRLRDLSIEQLQEELSQQSFILVNAQAELAETIRLRDLGIEQLQEELSQQSFILVNAQAELAYLRSRHPRARAKRLLERFGFLITPLLPISLLRRSKRMVRKLLNG